MDDRIVKLESFICGPRYVDLDEVDKELLFQQLLAMNSYGEILDKRIERL